MRDLVLYVMLVLALFAIPRLVEEPDPPMLPDPTGGKAGKDFFGSATFRAGRRVSGGAAGWLWRKAPKWRERAVLLLDACGLGAYTPGDLLASMVGYGLLFGGALFVLSMIAVPALSVVAGGAGLGIGCALRWQAIAEMGRKRQVACRLAGTRFASRLRGVLQASGSPLPAALLRVCEIDRKAPLHDEVRKAVVMAQGSPAITLDEALAAAAVRMGAPMLKRLFAELCRAEELGQGRIDACNRYVIGFYEELEFQVKHQSNKLAVSLLVTTVVLGLPSALIQIMLIPVLQFMGSLRGLGG